jgi:peptidyl-prolyl cis-trans isomerase B (cyclophilin B)
MRDGRFSPRDRVADAWQSCLPMKKFFFTLFTVVSVAAVSFDACAADDAKEVAVLKTNKGEMVAEFWPEVAPKTVENFKKLAKDGFYDGTVFHRIIKGFMIQGGDPLSKDPSKESQWGTGGPGTKLKAEFNDRKHVRGVLSMARSADPDSAGSQFFLMLGDAPFLDNKYTGFGKLIKGEEVLAKIGDTPVGPNASGEPSKPRERVVLESVKIVPASSIK